MDISRVFKQIRKPCDGTYWLVPPLKWIKINFDGATKGNPGPTGCGGVTRDSNGICISVVALPLGIQTNHIAEAIGSY